MCVCYTGVRTNSDSTVRKKTSCQLHTTVRGTIVFSQYFNLELCKKYMNRLYIKQNYDLTVPSGHVMYIVTVEPEGFVTGDGGCQILLLSFFNGLCLEHN